ncbi:MAG: alkaline phosphatase [Bacteroidetes bacterium]|nr:alkaline phosphatase [Bacteroidota bacterium]MBL7103976.1 alkaline phosphatase [Bacteroidales bacterium]
MVRNFKSGTKKMIFSFLFLLSFLIVINCNSQSDNSEGNSNPDNYRDKKAKNIILMIGDGMGVSHIYAGITANKGHLNIEKLMDIGFSKTHSADNYITDSGAGGTAIAIGYKTFNAGIGVDADTIPRETILEYAEENGKATGLVATSAITHATPASFIAHQPSRYLYEEIAGDFLKTDIEVFIGGGLNHFNKRKDDVDLTVALKDKGYQLVYELEGLKKINSGKLAGLLYEDAPPKYSEGRGDMLPVASMKAIEILSKDKDGFFLMIEGSQIDWAGHANDTKYIVDEMLDFDRTIGKVLEFAEKDGNTLVIVTADHETGGMGLNNGDLEKGEVIAKYTSGNHTGVMVPVFAYGPGSDNFRGIYENTGIFYKMMEAFGFSINEN